VARCAILGRSRHDRPGSELFTTDRPCVVNDPAVRHVSVEVDRGLEPARKPDLMAIAAVNPLVTAKTRRGSPATDEEIAQAQRRRGRLVIDRGGGWCGIPIIGTPEAVVGERETAARVSGIINAPPLHLSRYESDRGAYATAPECWPVPQAAGVRRPTPAADVRGADSRPDKIAILAQALPTAVL